MGSVLFGFGILLVGAILLIIATGGQKRPPLKETAEEKKTPMTYVGPGLMGVGGFFVIVGTIMCLFETRILRRRKNTDHESLVRSEILPTGHSRDPRTESRQKDCTNVEETQVKTVQTTCHAESPVESLEKSLHDKSSEEKDYERQPSTSTDKEKQSFTASVYVDAIGENDTDENDNEEHFTSGSMQFSTPPENKEDDVLKFSLDRHSPEGHDPARIPNLSQGIHVTEKETSVLHQKENESVQSVSEGNESSLLVPKDDKIPVSNDSIQTVGTSLTDERDADLTDTTIHPVHVPESIKELASSDVTLNQDSKSEATQVLSPTGLPDTTGKGLPPDSHETTVLSPQNTDPTDT